MAPFLAVAQALGQRAAGEQAHDHVHQGILHAVVMDGDDVRVLQGGGGAGLQDKALLVVGVGGELDRQNLDGDLALQAGLVGAVDGAHAAQADQFFKDVLAQPLAGQPADVDRCHARLPSSAPPAAVDRRR